MQWSIEVVSVITTGAVAILSTLVPAALRGWDHRQERTMLRLTKDMESRALLWDQRSRIYADVLDFVWKHYRFGERGPITHLLGGSYPEEERPALAALSARLDVYASPAVASLGRSVLGRLPDETHPDHQHDALAALIRRELADGIKHMHLHNKEPAIEEGPMPTPPPPAQA